MEVILKAITANPVSTIIDAYRKCHQSEDCSDSTGSILGEKDRLLLRKCIVAGHESPLEHVNFTFTFKISRAAQTQLIRHRISSFSIESQRYVECSEYFIPVAISSDEDASELFLSEMDNILETYQRLLEIVPKEDARYILPNCMLGDIQYTANLRSLRNAIAERTCKHAQTEIRELFTIIKGLVGATCPDFLYRCEKVYRCGQASICGRCRT